MNAVRVSLGFIPDLKKIMNRAGKIIKGTMVFVRKRKASDSPNGVSQRLFSEAFNASRKLRTKKNISGTSKFPERARKINQGDEASAIEEASPTMGEETLVPSKKMTIKVESPRIAEEAREPNSLSPNMVWEREMSQKPAGG